MATKLGLTLAGMSGPALATTVGLQLGSMLMNSMAKRRQERARAGFLEAQDQRIGGLMDEALGHTEQNIDQYREPALEEKTQAKKADLDRMSLEHELPLSTISDEMVGPQGNTPVMVGALERARAPEQAYAAQQGDAQRRLRSSGDAMHELGLDTARTGQRVGKLGSFMTGAAGPLQLELQAAAGEGGGLQRLGDLFQLGSAVSAGGIFGGGGGGAAGNLMTKSAPYPGPGNIMRRSF